MTSHLATITNPSKESCEPTERRDFWFFFSQAPRRSRRLSRTNNMKGNYRILLVLLSVLVCQLRAMQITKKTSGVEKENNYPASQHLRSTISVSQAGAASPSFNGAASQGHKTKALRALLTKIYSGRPLNMITIGGSNSAGGGVKKANQLFYNLFTDWWNRNIYNMTSSQLTSYKMAIGGTGSDFFSFCYQNFLPKEQPDMVLVELSVNDYGYKYGEAAKPMEMLTRRLLLMPSKPLVIYVHLVDRGLYGSDVTNPDCLNMEDLGFTQLAEHYGIMSLSMRDFVCPLTSSGKREKIINISTMFSTDGTAHVGFRTHGLIASILIDYFNKSLSDYLFSNLRSSQGLDENREQSSLRNPLFLGSDFELTRPLCLSYLTPNWEIPLQQTLTANISQSIGFVFVPPSKSIRQYTPYGAKRSDASAGWSSQSNNSFLKVQFEVPSTSRDSPLSSVAVILQNVPATTSVEMWLNDERSSSLKINRDIKCNNTWLRTRMYPIATNVYPGIYTLNIVSKLKGRVIFSGLVIGYPGYHDYKGYQPRDVLYRVWSLRDYQKWRC